MQTYQATIYCGLLAPLPLPAHTYRVSDIIRVCRQFTKVWGIGVAVTKTKFVYSGDVEPGVTIKFANCPETDIDIKKLAIQLAEILKERFRQDHVIVVCTDETIKI